MPDDVDEIIHIDTSRDGRREGGLKETRIVHVPGQVIRRYGTNQRVEICAAYRNGKRVEDIEYDRVRDFAIGMDRFVWIGNTLIARVPRVACYSFAVVACLISTRCFEVLLLESCLQTQQAMYRVRG